jgi:hypothetical protein
MPLTKVSAGVIAANAVQESVGSQSITGDKLGLTAINANNIVGGSITGAKLAANTVSGDVIGQNAISSNNIVSVNASVATVGTLPTARLPAGSVLQVVHSTYTTQQSSTSTDYADTNLSASITPTSSSSKILVIVSHNGNLVTGAQNAISNFRLLRGSTPLINEFAAVGNSLNNIEVVYGAASASYLDSPATTSSTTYKTQFKNKYGAGTVFTNAYDAAATMTLLEIAA